jgi:hypothetical protein
MIFYKATGMGIIVSTLPSQDREKIFGMGLGKSLEEQVYGSSCIACAYQV